MLNLLGLPFVFGWRGSRPHRQGFGEPGDLHPLVREPQDRTEGLEEETIPLRLVRRNLPYQEIPDHRERRIAVVTLHSEGWSAKATAGYLRAHKATVHRILKR